MTTWTLPLSYDKPPLTLNSRMHWAAKAKTVAAIRHESATRARSLGIGSQRYITVQLHYRPRDKRIRDRSNLLGTQKPLLDGLVDAGVVPDDDDRYVDEQMPKIHPPSPEGPALWLTITIGDPP